MATVGVHPILCKLTSDRLKKGNHHNASVASGVYFYTLSTGSFNSTRKMLVIRLGLLGDHRSIGEGVFELRLDFGPGYRIYFGRIGSEYILLLTGGTKNSQ